MSNGINETIRNAFKITFYVNLFLINITTRLIYSIK